MSFGQNPGFSSPCADYPLGDRPFASAQPMGDRSKGYGEHQILSRTWFFQAAAIAHLPAETIVPSNTILKSVLWPLNRD
jgi:hypothetical protein